MCKTGNLTVSTGWVVRRSDRKALSCALGSVPRLALGCVHRRRGREMGPTEAPVQRRAVPLLPWAAWPGAETHRVPVSVPRSSSLLAAWWPGYSLSH